MKASNAPPRIFRIFRFSRHRVDVGFGEPGEPEIKYFVPRGIAMSRDLSRSTSTPRGVDDRVKAAAENTWDSRESGECSPESNKVEMNISVVPRRSAGDDSVSRGGGRRRRGQRAANSRRGEDSPFASYCGKILRLGYARPRNDARNPAARYANYFSSSEATRKYEITRIFARNVDRNVEGEKSVRIARSYFVGTAIPIDIQESAMLVSQCRTSAI